MNLFDLVAKITLDSSEAESGISSFGSKMKSGLANAGKVGAAAVGAVTTAGAALTTTLVKGAGDVASYGDNIDKMSQKMGISAQAYQEWDAVLQHSGTSIDSMSRGMQTLQRNAVNSAEKFEALGITQEQLASMSTEELFSATITGLQNMGEGAERTALASELLGGSAKELGALLNTSAEETQAMKDRVHELGGIMSDDAVKSAAKYQDSLQDMQTAFSGLSRGLLSDMMPSITSVMDGLTEIFSGNGEAGIEMISAGIDQLLTNISEKLPQFMDIAFGILSSFIDTLSKNLPKFLEIGAKLIGKIISGIISKTPELLKSAVDLIGTLGQTLIDNIPALYDTIFSAIDEIVNFIAESAPTLIASAVQLLVDLAMALTDPANLDHMFQCSLTIIQALADGILKAIPVLLEALPQIINNIVQFYSGAIPQMIQVGFELFMSLVGALPDIIVGIVEAIPEIILGLVDALTESLPQMVESGFVLFVSLIEKLPEIIVKLVAAVPKIIESIVEAFVKLLPKIFDLGVKLLTSILTGILNTIGSIAGVISEVGAAIRDGFVGIINSAMTWGKDLIDNFVGGIKSVAHKVGDAVKGVADKIKGLIGFSEPEDPESPLHRFHTFAPDMMELFAKGVKENTSLVTDQIKKSFNFGDDIVSVGNAGVGFGGNGYRSNTPTASEPPTPITIIVQSVLDRRVIGETAYNYALDKNRVTGG